MPCCFPLWIQLNPFASCSIKDADNNRVSSKTPISLFGLLVPHCISHFMVNEILSISLCSFDLNCFILFELWTIIEFACVVLATTLSRFHLRCRLFSFFFYLFLSLFRNFMQHFQWPCVVFLCYLELLMFIISFSDLPWSSISYLVSTVF